jgi:phage regulator Rha-like protein
MKQLAVPTKNQDFSVFENGEAYISQTKLADLCGVTHQAISLRISKLACSLNLNENNQLSAESAFLLAGYYANKGNPQDAQQTMSFQSG